MRAEIKTGLVVIIPETDAEVSALAAWRMAYSGHVFGLTRSGALRDLGADATARREPINITSTSADPRWRRISNLAETPFVLRGRPYASVEGFWQGLKFADEDARERIAKLSGAEAVRAGRGAPAAERFTFAGEGHYVGGPGHHRLMYEACWEKFSQNEAARAALLSTGGRPLTHRTRRDSVTIPGALMADCWMRIRARLSGGADDPPDGRILYFRRDRDVYGFLSHFEPSPIELDGESWPTVEHYYQAQKSSDPAYRAAIRAAATPGDAKQLASVAPAGERSWFVRNGQPPRADWREVKLDIMRRADATKFAQNPQLAARLRATGQAELIEDSPYDDFWGAGAEGAGQNWAGRILMEIRASLAATQ